MPTVEARDITVDLGGARVLDGVTVAAVGGEWLSIVGPNGAGKTTLLKAVAGLVAFEGEVLVEARSLRGLSHRERSRTIALVPQVPVVPGGMTVGDYVLLGRTPHIPFFGVEQDHDLAVVSRALDQLELRAFARRPLATLSGGERQRAVLARALAQDAPLLLLDEPTTALDVGHQQEVLDLVDELRRSRDLTVVSTMHDLTLAGQYGDCMVMLDAGRVVAAGAPEEVLTEDHVRRHYGARVQIFHHGGGVIVAPLRDDGPAAPARLRPTPGTEPRARVGSDPDGS